MIDFFEPPEPGSARPFSRATRAGGLIFVSGHAAPHDPERGIARGDTPGEEVDNALAEIARILAAHGRGLADIVQVAMLIRDREDYAACNAAYVRHFPGGLPARHTALFGVPGTARVAFSCIALAGD